MRNDNKPIVIRKVVARKEKHQRHGGAWKVAYADFMTAMMAFFLLLWLLSSAPETKTVALAAYFNPEMQLSNLGAEGVMEGNGIDEEEGIYQSGDESQPEREGTALPESTLEDGLPPVRIENPWLSFTSEFGGSAKPMLIETPAQVELAPDLAVLNDTLGAFFAKEQDQAMLRLTEDGGVEINLLDPDGKPLFASGSFDVSQGFAPIMAEIIAALNATEGNITLTGHSDSQQLKRENYSNWELSSDRAHALRRALIAAGLDPSRITSVSGVADTLPLDPERPDAEPNRRVSIRIYPKTAATQ